MSNVVRFEKTKRKLNWKQEESLRLGKKQSGQRRNNRLTGRELKGVGEEE